MAQRVWTAAELERLSPAEQDAIFAAGIVRDLADVPPEFLARVRARLEDHIAGTASSIPLNERHEGVAPSLPSCVAGLVRDLADVPPEFLARVRARLEDHIAGTESPDQ
jgi:hypothetical protein